MNQVSVLVIGIFFSAFAILCAMATFENPADRSFFGIPIGLIGVIGYIFMLFIRLLDKTTLFKILVALTGVITILLVVKSFTLGTACMFCVACWILNIFLGIVTFRRTVAH